LDSALDGYLEILQNMDDDKNEGSRDAFNALVEAFVQASTVRLTDGIKTEAHEFI
jgi:hypothetical protein